MRYFYSIFIFFLLISCSNRQEIVKTERILFYNQPANTWNEALPVGNGRLGAMVFGTVSRECIQFNEETLWTGGPHDYSHPGAAGYLDTLRTLILDGKAREAEKLAMVHFMSVPVRQEAYQPFGDLCIEFPDHEFYTDYQRSLDISKAICRTEYKVNGVTYIREVLASYPDQVIAIKLTANENKALKFGLTLHTPHEGNSIYCSGGQQTLEVEVKESKLKGIARIDVETDGLLVCSDHKIQVQDAKEATIYLTAATNFVDYRDVSGDPLARIDEYLNGIKKKSFSKIRKDHIADYRSFFDRFDIGFGKTARDTMTMNKRLMTFNESPVDPGLVSLYVQYGRYLMISSSRPGTQPANLQGIWNNELQPPWESKYTLNINAEMNYWPAELTNLSECHQPLFNLIEDCSETGSITAREHYGAGGWVIHHNTDIWRGTAPINASDHGIWLGGAGWLCTHLWEHYLYTLDIDFLKETAWPLMKGAAQFYLDYLFEDPETGWLISVPSNSPEIGGLVAGPTMDHQIIRSLFRDCIESTEIMDKDHKFAEQLRSTLPHIAPNQIGRYGQLQEWLEDRDNPEVKHRHVSHLWGVHPGDDITWEKSPELMQAARQSLLFRGDEGTGWSLAWKINFRARFLDGDHAYELIKMLFRVKEEDNVNWGGGSYINLFDAHPPFQIDGNFGAAAGIVELLIQSHQGFIDLLPALPSALPNGYIKGVCARGGFEIDMEWKDCEMKQLRILSKAGHLCKLRYNDKMVSFETEKGEDYYLGKNFIL